MSSFEKNASPLLRAIVEEIAPEAIGAEVVAERLTYRQSRDIRIRVARQFFDRKFRSDYEVERFLKRGTHEQRDLKSYKLSQVVIPLDGIGDDSFYLNEYFSEEGPFLSGFETMRSWDEYNHNKQEQYHAEEGNRPDGVQPYDGRMLWDWSRWLEDGRMVYGNLSVAVWHLYAKLESFASDLASERYKTEWIEGPEHGKRTGSGIRWNMVETPAGSGALRFAAEHIAQAIIKVLAAGPYKEKIAASGVWVSRVRKEENGEIDERVVFSGVEAMTRVRFRHWRKDLEALPDGNVIYQNIVDIEKAYFEELMELVFFELEEAYKQIGDATKDNWRDLYNIAMPALIAKHARLEGVTFEPEKCQED